MDKIWYISSIRILKPKQIKYILPFYKRHLLPFFKLFKFVKRKKSLSGGIKYFFEYWKECRSLKTFPVESRTWGFLFNRETAIRYAEQNITDLNEAGYYQFVAVEGCEQGLLADIYEDDQIFFAWKDNKWQKLDAPPCEIKQYFDSNSRYFSFVDHVS